MWQRCKQSTGLFLCALVFAYAVTLYFCSYRHDKCYIYKPFFPKSE